MPDGPTFDADPTPESPIQSRLCEVDPQRDQFATGYLLDPQHVLSASTVFAGPATGAVTRNTQEQPRDQRPIVAGHPNDGAIVVQVDPPFPGDLPPVEVAQLNQDFPLHRTMVRAVGCQPVIGRAEQDVHATVGHLDRDHALRERNRRGFGEWALRCQSESLFPNFVGAPVFMDSVDQAEFERVAGSLDVYVTKLVGVVSGVAPDFDCLFVTPLSNRYPDLYRTSVQGSSTIPPSPQLGPRGFRPEDVHRRLRDL